MPYWVYYLEHSKHKPSLHFATRKQFPTDHYRGSLNMNQIQTSYLFYELKHVDDFTSSDQEVLWKVTPYEILYTREVVGIPIHPDCIQLFKAYPKLCFVEDDEDEDKDLIHEVPVVSYLGVGASEIQEQILLQSNQKVGPLGKGYYFKKYEDALYDAYYKEDTENLIEFENKSHLDDRTIQDDRVVLKGNSFYHGRHYLGDSNACNKNLNYSIYYYDEEVIYLKSNKPHHCETEVQLRKESGYVMRYILFLKNHRIGSNPKKGFDSYASDSTYMIKNADHFNCLSYHFIKKK
jgi:hypothetical protein